MGVDTHFVIENTLEELLNFLDQYGFHYGQQENFDISYDKTRRGYINLIRLQIDKGSMPCREMFIHEMVNSTEYLDRGIPKPITGVWCDLTHFDESILYGKIVCQHFGGWLDENDCDSEDFYRINKKEVGTLGRYVMIRDAFNGL